MNPIFWWKNLAFLFYILLKNKQTKSPVEEQNNYIGRSYVDLKGIFVVTKITVSTCVDYTTPANFTSCLGYHFLVKVGKTSQLSPKLTDCPRDSHLHMPALDWRRSRFRTWHWAAEWHCSQNSRPRKSHWGIWTLQCIGQMTKMKHTMHVSGTRNLNGVIITSLV